MDFQLIDGLVDVLKDEEEIYKEILKSCRKKTNIIVEGNIAALENATRFEQVKIFKISDLEGIREKIIARLAAVFGRKASELNVTLIKSLIPEDRAQKLNDANANLLKALKELKEVNSLNAKLIKNSLEYIDFSVNLLTGAELSGNLYGNSGQAGDVKKRTFFDVKL